MIIVICGNNVLVHSGSVTSRRRIRGIEDIEKIARLFSDRGEQIKSIILEGLRKEGVSLGEAS